MFEFCVFNFVTFLVENEDSLGLHDGFKHGLGEADSLKYNIVDDNLILNVL